MWSTVLIELEKLYPTHACTEFLRCYPLFNFRPDEVGACKMATHCDTQTLFVSCFLRMPDAMGEVHNGWAGALAYHNHKES